MRTPIAALITALALSGVATASLADSTQLSPPNTKTVLPTANIDTNDCVAATAVKAAINPISGGTNQDGVIASNCPTGYVAYGMNATVSVPSQVMKLKDSNYSWQTNCCRAVVSYKGTA